MERFFDILLSSFALVILSPLFLIIIIILKFSGEGEIFFVQERIGKGGKLFRLLKFATMLKDSPYMSAGTITMRDDPRILPFGKFLRRSKINELPQLFNIFYGDMSVIGPRPLTLQNFRSYPHDAQMIVKKVRPGLSGIGSIIFRGEEEIMHGATANFEFYENVIAPYKGLVEKWFVLNKGLYTYFTAIFVTVWVIFNPKSKLPWLIFRGLPHPPMELRQVLNFPNQVKRA